MDTQHGDPSRVLFWRAKHTPTSSIHSGSFSRSRTSAPGLEAADGETEHPVLQTPQVHEGSSPRAEAPGRFVRVSAQGLGSRQLPVLWVTSLAPPHPGVGGWQGRVTYMPAQDQGPALWHFSIRIIIPLSLLSSPCQRMPGPGSLPSLLLHPSQPIRETILSWGTPPQKP